MASPIPMGIADMQGNLIEFNDAILVAGGYSREDIAQIGNVAKLYADPAERRDILTMAQSQNYIKRYPTKFLRKDGSYYRTYLSLQKIVHAGEPYWLAIVESFTFNSA